MQKQIEKPIVETTKNEKLESLKESFSRELSKPVDTTIVTEAIPQTRTVVLWYASGCGCGGAENYISREVPYDSELQNGDRARDLESKDKQISKKEYRKVTDS
jgi:hypothetical protein